MKYEIRYKPAFSTIFLTLKPGEGILAEAGAMASMDGGIEAETRLSGGLFPAIARKIFGKESLFVNIFRNRTGESCELALTQTTIGDIECLELKNTEICLQPGAFIAHTTGIKMGVAWAGFASLISGEGLFKLKLAGKGLVFFGAYGGISSTQIDGDLIVDNGHLVAYEPSIRMSIRLSGGLFGSLTSGEGLVNRLSGRGKVYLQSRSLDSLVAYLRPKCRG